MGNIGAQIPYDDATTKSAVTHADVATAGATLQNNMERVSIIGGVRTLIKKTDLGTVVSGGVFSNTLS